MKSQRSSDPQGSNAIEQLFEHLDTLKVKHLEYIVCLHAEQDHSGGAPMLLQRYPKAVIVAPQKVADFLESHLHLPKDKMKIVEAGDTIELGGVSLECIPVPFAHWPDNTMYWLADEYLLFSYRPLRQSLCPRCHGKAGRNNSIRAGRVPILRKS